LTQPSAPLSNVPSPDVSTPSSAAGVSLRLDGHVPAHPSASTFRLGHFLRSWQGSVGTAMLLLALGVTVFALLRGGTNARDVAPAAAIPQTPTPLTAAQQPVPTPATQPSPAFPTPDAQNVLPITDPAYAVPNTAGQPFYVPQGAPAPVQSNVPSELTVVSENGAPSTSEDPRARRKTEQNANESAPARGESRGDTGADAAARSTRTPEPEQRPTLPPTQSSPPPPAAPQPTPGRAKVIPWPPQ